MANGFTTCPIKHSMRESEWIRAAGDDGFARRRKPKQQDGGELSGNELSILLLAMGYLRPNNRLIGSAGSSA